MVIFQVGERRGEAGGGEDWLEMAMYEASKAEAQWERVFTWQ